jgi:hypothetical protein
MHHISKAFTIACSKLEKIGNGMILVCYLFVHLISVYLFHRIDCKVPHPHGVT